MVTLKDELTSESRGADRLAKLGKYYLLGERKDASDRRNMQMVSGFVSTVVCWTEQLPLRL